jgi:hypothetical protein
LTDQQDDFEVRRKPVAVSGLRKMSDLYEPTITIKKREGIHDAYPLLLVYADDRRNDGTFHTIDTNRANADELLLEAIEYHLDLAVIRDA